MAAYYTFYLGVYIFILIDSACYKPSNGSVTYFQQYLMTSYSRFYYIYGSIRPVVYQVTF